MTWRKNARTITKEHFSDGTTIDGNRIDTALDDVVDRVNEVPYGDLRKRWVPITYVAGWTPQSPTSIETGEDPTDSVNGKISATHHWPWMVVRNTGTDQVVDGTTGSTLSDDDLVTNPYRAKGAQAPGVFPFGGATAGAGAYSDVSTPIGEQYAWTRSWFLEKPSILDAINLVFELDNSAAPTADKIYTNTFLYGTTAPDGYAASSDDHGLAIIATVDNEFDREDQNLADIEVMRKTFRINNDKLSPLTLPTRSDTGGAPYDDFAPKPQVNAAVGASTVGGVRIHLDSLNIPIHQNARLRVSVVIPNYPSTLQPCGWHPSSPALAKPYPWLQQKVHMTVTMLEEVTSG
jgi:hypothetical protein